MTKIETSTFLVQAIITDINCRVKRPIPTKELGVLFATLTSAQKICENEEMAGQIIVLYGKIIDAFNRYVEEEIVQLKSIKDPFLLQKKIAILRALPGISETNLAALYSFKKRRSQTERKSSKILFIEEIIPQEVEEIIEELFEAASSIYYAKELSSYKLPSVAEKKLLKHASYLHISLFKDKLGTLQALFATAYELANKPCRTYLSYKEIKIFFREREEIIKKDQKNPTYAHPFLRHA